MIIVILIKIVDIYYKIGLVILILIFIAHYFQVCNVCVLFLSNNLLFNHTSY